MTDRVRSNGHQLAFERPQPLRIQNQFSEIGMPFILDPLWTLTEITRRREYSRRNAASSQFRYCVVAYAYECVVKRDNRVVDAVLKRLLEVRPNGLCTTLQYVHLPGETASKRCRHGVVVQNDAGPG